jgi:hypothetical protein
MTRLICLANSWKHGDRCIAGIDVATATWVRPVSDLEDGRIPEAMRLVDGEEPKILDILDIPLAKSSPSDLRFAWENRAILPGTWKRVGRAKVVHLFNSPWHHPQILHNARRYVSIYQLCQRPNAERQTLQLVYTPKLVIQSLWQARKGRKWQGQFSLVTGEILPALSITDPVLIERVERGYRPKNPCLVTVSLSMPFCPSDTWEGDEPCWKLIAGVIELSEPDLILGEMQRLGWSLESGQKYLQDTYGKRSRQQLTHAELMQFLAYLRSLPNSYSVTPAQTAP